MRILKHPGPVGLSKTSVIPAKTREVRFLLEPGKYFLAALQHQLESLHAVSAVANIKGGSFIPFIYVMPALSKTPEHAVYFSDRFEPHGVVRLIEGCVTYGSNQGKPMLHCHARWVDASGQPGCGHLLPHECMIHEPIEVIAWVVEGAQFQVIPDEETNFSLFQPVAIQPDGQLIRRAKSLADDDQQVGGSGNPMLDSSDQLSKTNAAYAIRIGANQDVCQTITNICRERNILKAYFVGGVGSTIGAKFTDGSVVDPHVTELYLNSGTVTFDGSHYDVAIDVTMIDHLGGISSGRLLSGDNPVLVTMELVMVAEQTA
jgi:predicted DNA-binding protein with PD1-like motif